MRFTLLIHLPLLTDAQHLEGLALGVQGHALNQQLQVHPPKALAVVKVVHRQLPQTGTGKAH